MYNPRFVLQFAFGSIVLCTSARAEILGNLIDDFQRARYQGKPAALLNIDNDSLLLNHRDGFYTSGIRLEYRYALDASAQSTVFGWRIGQELFSASDIKLPPALIGPPDHPYAGWLYGGFFRDVSHADGSRVKIGVDLGCLGPCAAGEWTQTNLHRLLGQPMPQGWSKQVKNEVGVVLYADVAPVRWRIGRALDITPNLHGRIGNIYTDIGMGATLRVGRLAALPAQATLHGFARIDANAIGYNATLQGGYFSSGNPHTVAPKRAVGEVEMGLVWNNGAYNVQASVVRRSNEIEGLSNGIGAQSFARLTFLYKPIVP